LVCIRVRVRGSVRVAIFRTFLRLLRYLFNMALEGPEHKVESIVMGCCTNDRMRDFGLRVCFEHVLPELLE